MIQIIYVVVGMINKTVFHIYIYIELYISFFVLIKMKIVIFFFERNQIFEFVFINITETKHCFHKLNKRKILSHFQIRCIQ